MSGNSIGKSFTVTTFGESHGKALGCIIDGCPPGIAISEQDIQVELNKRRPGQSKFTTQRKESDKVQILSGDEQKAVELFGESLGIRANQCTGNVSPEEKASYVEKRSVTRRTLMAGDGFNDSGALAVADVGSF